MATKNYTTKTAALRATIADVNKLETKKLKVNGKDVATSIKHPNDTREVITENDLWGSWAEIKDGEIIFHDDEVTNPNGWQIETHWGGEITKIENNKAYVGNTLYANIQTENITTAAYMFSGSDCKLTSWNGDLPNLKNGLGMFYKNTNLTTFNGDLSNFKGGWNHFGDCSQGMFQYCTNLTTFTSDLNSLTNGSSMFTDCTNLTAFTSDLSSLTQGDSMFQNCYTFTAFTSDLSSLTYSNWMFRDCYNLIAFTSDLSSLTRAYGMFYNCKKLTTFSSDLSSLKDGSSMFSNSSKLATFTSDLSSLTKGYSMFNGCSELSTFASNLSSLTNGNNMFHYCKLNTDSLIHIAETIKDVRDLTNGKWSDDDINKTIHIGIGSTTPTEEETELLTEIHNKGWQVYVGCNGGSHSEFTPTALTPIDGEEVTTPTPYWAKPQETDEEHAEYVGEDGKFYIILGGNYIFVDDPETYGMFVSLEDAAANMRLTKIEKTTNQN